MGIKHIAVKTSKSVGLATEWNDDHKIDGDVDFDKHQALSLAIENRTNFPAAPVAGQTFYKSDVKRMYYYDGTSWQKVSIGGINHIENKLETQVFVEGSVGYIECTGLTYNFTLTADSYVIIDANLLIQNEPGSSGSEVGMNIEIDGISAGFEDWGWLEEETDGLDVVRPIIINYGKELSAGAHSIKIMVALGGFGPYKTAYLSGMARYIISEK